MALFVLFMTDFILTYIGISAGIIVEVNPLLIWLFELPFLTGVILRILIGVIVINLPIRTIKTGKIRPAIAKTYYWVAYMVNVGILVVHLYWIIDYTRVAW